MIDLPDINPALCVAQLCYAAGVDRRLQFKQPAVDALADMRKVDRKVVLDGIRLHLIENDPLETTRNKFPLRRLSVHAERELRLDRWRVFYFVANDGALVIVALIGVKRGNKLYIAGEEFEL